MGGVPFSFVGLVFLTALLFGCRSNEPLKERELPLHVVIIPISAPIVAQATPAEDRGKKTKVVLALEGEEVTRALATVLEDYCFTRATVLELGHGDDSSADDFEHQRALLAQARELGADLILELGLRYDPDVYRKVAPMFWLNYPLFLFFSPSNWFLPDNTYFADVELKTTVYDLNALEAGRLTLGDPAAEVLSTSARFDGTTLDFVDRARGIGDYALTLLVPSGFLARQSGDVTEEVHAAILESLQTQLVQSLQNRRVDLVRAASIAPVFVEPADVHVERTGDVVRINGRARLHRGSLAGRVHAIHLEAGAGRVSVEPTHQSEAASTDNDVFVFEAPVPLGDEASYLRLECEAGSRDRYIRSYTFRIPVD